MPRWISFGRKTKSGRNRTAAPMNAREISVRPANQIPAGTAMIPARTRGHAHFAEPEPGSPPGDIGLLRIGENADKSNAPIACSTPHQNVRTAEPSVIGSHALGDQDLKDRAGVPTILRAEIPDPAHLRPLPATGPDLDRVDPGARG
jgi:hypothetical protein